ncbi:MAG: hypothetical protein RIS47_2146 [Bacteroidota bacterium]|jgi:exonuclease SbcD
MKILHTSDWHLGHRLHEHSQFEVQQQFLNWLQVFINEQHIDVLLIAGDVFDTAVPSAQSQTMYYDFLIGLRQTKCSQVVIIGGNHDAPGMINAPKALLGALSIRVVGKATELPEDEVFLLEVANEKLVVAAVPYLRDQDIRRAVAGESGEELGSRYRRALVAHYNAVAQCVAAYDLATIPVVAMGHLFAIGGKVSESEQTIYVGNLGDISALDFPNIFDYVALGHLHKSQIVADNECFRYSGSPYMLSFSELNSPKQVLVVETSGKTITRVEPFAVPVFREFRRVEGNIDFCLQALRDMDAEQLEIEPWVEIVLDRSVGDSAGFQIISDAARDLQLKVLRVSFSVDHAVADLNSLLETAQQLKDLSPPDVFALRCKELNFDLEQRPDVLDAFYALWQSVRESND